MLQPAPELIRERRVIQKQGANISPGLPVDPIQQGQHIACVDRPHDIGRLHDLGRRQRRWGALHARDERG